MYWEGALIHQYIYDEKGNKRFVPILIGDTADDSVPLPLRPFTRYRVNTFDLTDPGFEARYRRLTGRPAIVRPVIGQQVDLFPRNSLNSKGGASVILRKTHTDTRHTQTTCVSKTRQPTP